MTARDDYRGDVGLDAVQAQLQAWKSAQDGSTTDGRGDVADNEWRRFLDWPAFASTRFAESAVAEAGDHEAASGCSNPQPVSVPAAWREDIERQLAHIPIGATRVLIVRCPDKVSQRVAARCLISSLCALNQEGPSAEIFSNLRDTALTNLLSPKVLLSYHWLSGEGDDDPQSNLLADMEEAFPGDWTDQLEALAGIRLEDQWQVFNDGAYRADLPDAPRSFTVLVVNTPSSHHPEAESREPSSWTSRNGPHIFPFLDEHLALLDGPLRDVSTKGGPFLALIVDDADPRLLQGPAAAHLTATIRPHLSQWLGTTALDYADAIVRLEAITGARVLRDRVDDPKIVRQSCPECAWTWVGERLKHVPAVEANMLPLEPPPGDSGADRRRRPAAQWHRACELPCPLEDISPLAEVGNEPDIESVTLRDSFLNLTTRMLALGPEHAGASFADVFADVARSLRETPTSLQGYRTLIEQQLLARAVLPVTHSDGESSNASPVLARLRSVLRTASDGAGPESARPWELALRAWPAIRDPDRGPTAREGPEPRRPPTPAREAPLTIDQLDANALRVAECLRNWFAELLRNDRETLGELGFGSDDIRKMHPDVSLADALGWMRDPGSEGAARQWKPISTMAEELADIFGRRRWREELQRLAKRTSVPIGLAGPTARRTNARYAQTLLSRFLDLAPTGPLGPPGAVRRLREAITRIKSDGGGLTEALRRLEALMKYLIVSTGLLIPRASWQRWRRGGEDRAPLPEVATAAQTELIEHVSSLEMRPLMNLWSQLRKRADTEMKVCYGDSDPWAEFERIIELRNKTVHHCVEPRALDRDDGKSVASPQGDADLITTLCELAANPAPWQALPLVAEVLDERVGHLGSRVTFRTELGEDVVAPLHFVDGQRWERGELVAQALLLVTRGQLADWSHPVAIVYRADLLDSFCGTGRVTKA